MPCWRALRQARDVRGAVDRNSLALPGEHLDQLRIRLRKRQLAELRSRNPRDLLAKHRLRFAVKIAFVEIQADRVIGIGMGDAVQAGADMSENVELFVQLATERLDVRFGRQAFATWKLPPAFEMRPCGAEGQQERVVSPNHRRHDHDR